MSFISREIHTRQFYCAVFKTFRCHVTSAVRNAFVLCCSAVVSQLSASDSEACTEVCETAAECKEESVRHTRVSLAFLFTVDVILLTPIFVHYNIVIIIIVMLLWYFPCCDIMVCLLCRSTWFVAILQFIFWSYPLVLTDSLPFTVWQQDSWQMFENFSCFVRVVVFAVRPDFHSKIMWYIGVSNSRYSLYLVCVLTFFFQYLCIGCLCFFILWYCLFCVLCVSLCYIICRK